MGLMVMMTDERGPWLFHGMGEFAASAVPSGATVLWCSLDTVAGTTPHPLMAPLSAIDLKSPHIHPYPNPHHQPISVKPKPI